MSDSSGRVFSRAEPAHKQAIVRLLKENNEIAAMTGKSYLESVYNSNVYDIVIFIALSMRVYPELLRYKYENYTLKKITT